MLGQRLDQTVCADDRCSMRLRAYDQAAAELADRDVGFQRIIWS